MREHRGIAWLCHLDSATWQGWRTDDKNLAEGRPLSWEPGVLEKTKLLERTELENQLSEKGSCMRTKGEPHAFPFELHKDLQEHKGGKTTLAELLLTSFSASVWLPGVGRKLS